METAAVIYKWRIDCLRIRVTIRPAKQAWVGSVARAIPGTHGATHLTRSESNLQDLATCLGWAGREFGRMVSEAVEEEVCGFEAAVHRFRNGLPGFRHNSPMLKRSLELQVRQTSQCIWESTRAIWSMRDHVDVPITSRLLDRALQDHRKMGDEWSVETLVKDLRKIYLP